VRTLGIDLASADARTGVAVVTWTDQAGRLETLAQPASDALIEELAPSCDAIAIDAPLGWPTAFAAAIAAHGAGLPWPGSSTAELRLRRTDRLLGEEKIWPLSVSTDRIGIVAFRAARLLPRLGRGASPARDGSDGVFEVYPAAALARWRRQHRGYKQLTPVQEAGRTGILAWLAQRFALDLNGQEPRLVASSDLLDALICAVLAREAFEGRTEPVPEDDRDAARVEGWIHLPPAQEE
jgi:predicted nuclease with RNAse H fold